MVQKIMREFLLILHAVHGVIWPEWLSSLILCYWVYSSRVFGKIPQIILSLSMEQVK